jgi:WD40 repeat protein
MRVEYYLRHFPELKGDRQAVLLLLGVEFEHRCRGNAAVAPAELARRFPELQEEIQARLQTPLWNPPAAWETRPVEAAPTGVDPNRTTPESPAAASGGAGDGISSPGGHPTVPGYEILGVLGRGGMGVVYQARQVHLKRLVALKMILAVDQIGSEELARFRIEAEAVARLQHANIVQIFEVGNQGGRPYIALEFVEGGSLARKLARTPQTPRLAAELGEVLARAVHAAHRQGIVHRDLKPANVLLAGGPDTPLGQCVPKVGDFGLAKRLDDDSGQTRTGAIMGTPSYMAPEQAAGRTREIGAVTDVYALGGILYELLTGQPPFRGPTVLDTLELVRNQEPVPPTQLQPKVPRDLELICLKCLRKEPAQRYASAEQLAEELRRYLNGEPLLLTRPVGRGERLWRWCRRHPAWAAAVLLAAVSGAALLALVVGAIFTYQLRQEQGRTAIALDEAEVQRGVAQEQRGRAERLAASQAIDRHLLLCEQGDVSRGLLRLARTLATTPDEDLRRVCRLNLAAWGRRLAAVKALIPTTPGGNQANYPLVSPDGRIILTTTGDAALLWDAATGRSLGGPLRHDAALRAMTFSPDGRTVLTGGEDGSARFWDAATGKPQGEPLQTGGPVWGVFFSPADGKTILTTDKTTGRLWDGTTRQPIGVPLPSEGEPTVWPPLFSPDGRVLATRSDSNTVVHLWETATGRQIGQPISFAAGAGISSLTMIDFLAFSPDSRVFLLGCSGQRTGLLLETATGKAIETPVTLTPGSGATPFSPDGKTLASTCADGTTRLFEAATGKPLGKPLQPLGIPRPFALSAMVFSPDGKTLLTGSWDNTAQLWNAATGDPITGPLRHEGGGYAVGGAFRVNLAPNNPRGISAGAFIENGSVVMTAGQDQAIRFWNAATGELVAPPLRHRGPISGFRLSPDRTIGVSQTAEGSGWFWETETGRPLALLPEHQGPYQVQGFCAGGRALLTSGRDGFLRLLEVPTAGRDEIRLPHGGVTSVAFSPDGRTTLTGGTDGTARLWDAQSGKLFGAPFQHTAQVTRVAFSPDGRIILTATSDQGVNFWEAATGKRFGEPPPKHGFPAMLTTFSFAGNAVLFRNQPEAVQLWDLKTGKPAGPPLHHSRLRTMAASPDGRTVLTAGLDGTVQLWNGITGQTIGPPLKHDAIITFMTFSPDGRIALTGSYDRTARRWDAATGNPIGQPLKHQGGVAAVTFSPDGKMILTGCEDQSAQFWDAATGAPLGARLPHEDYVWTAAFSPDGRCALTGTKGQTYYLWDVATQKPIGTPFRHDGPITSAAFSPDGDMVLTGSTDSTARLWDTATGKPIGPPLLHGGSVDAVAFSPRGRTVLTGGQNDGAHLRPVPAPLTGETTDVRFWVEGLTGMKLDPDDVVRWLDAAAWEERRQGLRQRAGERGGAPPGK